MTLTTMGSVVELLAQTQELWEVGLRPLSFYKLVSKINSALGTEHLRSKSEAALSSKSPHLGAQRDRTQRQASQMVQHRRSWAKERIILAGTSQSQSLSKARFGMTTQGLNFDIQILFL